MSMKKCPTCNRTYADKSLSFCLDDGALLSAEYDSDETVAFSKEYPNPIQTDPNYAPDKSIATVVSSRVDTSPPKDFQTGAEKKNITPHFVYALAGLLAAVILVGSVIWLNSNSKSVSAVNSDTRLIPTQSTNSNKPSETETEKDTEKVISSPTPATSTTGGQETEALVLAGECTTPCKLDIQFKAKIRGEGNPLRITFPTADGPVSVDYPGEGDFKAPKGMEKGYTYFVSLNEKRPNVRVQLYKKITVP